MTESEKLIMRLALGSKARSRRDARICRKCNRVLEGDEWQHCGEPTWEFESKNLHRFERGPGILQAKPSIPAHVINREYPSDPHARFFSGGQCESNRRRH
jgi:hypothetical protein